MEQRLQTLVIWAMDTRREGVGKPTKHLLPGELQLMPDGGRNIKCTFRNLRMDEDTKGALVVV